MTFIYQASTYRNMFYALKISGKNMILDLLKLKLWKKVNFLCD